MKVILIDVMSLDGKLTKWENGNAYEWSSPEDAAHFSQVRGQNTLLVMGSGTFRVVTPQPEKERLRIVMTSHPETYQQLAVPGQLEFTNETPKTLVSRLEMLGYTQMLLVGGKKTATSFLLEDLVDELWLTIEPRIFGLGQHLVDAKKLDIALRLVTSQKLNEQGTLLLKYKVLKG